MTDSTTIDNVLKFQDELNPKLWDKDEELKPEAAKHLKYVAQRFVEWLAVPLVVKDVEILGSLTSYNWTPQSDIDLHIYVDLSPFKDKKTVKELFEVKTKLFKEKFPIKYEGLPIELTIEDDSNRAVSAGMYSLSKDVWIKKPMKVPKLSVDTDKAAEISGLWKQRIKNAIGSDTGSDKLNQLKDDLKAMRKQALKKDGEFADGNIAFKDLRKTGFVDKIKDARDEKFEDELSK